MKPERESGIFVPSTRPGTQGSQCVTRGSEARSERACVSQAAVAGREALSAWRSRRHSFCSNLRGGDGRTLGGTWSCHADRLPGVRIGRGARPWGTDSLKCSPRKKGQSYLHCQRGHAAPQWQWGLWLDNRGPFSAPSPHQSLFSSTPPPAGDL